MSYVATGPPTTTCAGTACHLGQFLLPGFEHLAVDAYSGHRRRKQRGRQRGPGHGDAGLSYTWMIPLLRFEHTADLLNQFGGHIMESTA